MHPNSNETGLGIRDDGATKIAYPSSSSDEEQCVVDNACCNRVISLDRIFGLGPSHVNKGLAMRNEESFCML
jgi:hypothetical protein